MPELPDIEAYVCALGSRIVGERLKAARVANPFLLRTVNPPLEDCVGRRARGVRRLGKRIVIEFAPSEVNDANAAPLFVVIHLMIAGRLHWKKPGSAIPKGAGLAALDFDTGTLLITEAGTRRRASLHVVEGAGALNELDPGGMEIIGSALKQFEGVLTRENHTLKRALTDPRLFSGIGNAYSDEILHRACLSPLKKTQSLSPDEVATLHAAAIEVLEEWTTQLCSAAIDAFPERVTAFREGMAAHGRFGSACPVCGAKIQRIVYAENECNYCPECQSGGRLLADRALSRLLKKDWPTQA